MKDMYKQNSQSVLLNLLEKIVAELKSIALILDKILAQVVKK